MFGECHAHLFMNGYDYHAAVRAHRDHPDEGVIRKELEAYRDAGVTFVRDGGDHYGVSVLARELAPEYGIRYLTPVFGIFREGHYGRVVGRPFSNLREYAQLVSEVKEQGGDFIKIMTSGIMTFETADGLSEEGLKREDVREMVRIAHESGMKVMSHTNGSRGVIDAAEAAWILWSMEIFRTRRVWKLLRRAARSGYRPARRFGILSAPDVFPTRF